MDSLMEQIHVLRERRKAVILAHNYTLPEVQDIADFVGDSLQLAFRAAAAKAEVIVFCGVHFMAETAKILNPAATVLMPDLRAGCPMADMVDVADLRRAKAELPGCTVVCYVNTSAAVKAESDVCCTSANAAALLDGISESDARPVLFVPDRNLGCWASKITGRKLVLWDGFCPTHERILPDHVRRMRDLHPEALLVAHPECTSIVRELADHVASTSGILSFCRTSRESSFVIATEHGLLHRLRIENPDKQFFEASPHMTCPNMKRTTVEKILWCLEDLSGEVTVEPEIAEKAQQAIERMLTGAPPGRVKTPGGEFVGRAE